MKAFILALALIILPCYSHALNLSLGVEHYSRIMENWHQEPKPDLLLPMFKSFESARLLANAEKRLLIAAFFSQVVLAGQLDIKSLCTFAKKMGRGGRRAAALIVHFSQSNPKLLQELLGKNDSIFLSQLKKLPAPPEAWDPASEKSGLDVCWGAFFASGKPIFAKKIIAAAMQYANGRNRKLGSLAAASLYDYSPGQPLILRMLEARLPAANSDERRMIETILKHSG